MVSTLATRLVGSPDLYSANSREPWHSVNFVTCHDGFTLADLVSYNSKHNDANGEQNRDGSNENWSWNCGAEGPTCSPEVARLRSRQVRNLATLMMVSQGVPMILAGDEVGRSQQGNNNAYCQDNELSWLEWDLLETNADLLRFFRLLLRLRRDHPLLRRGTFSPLANGESPQVEWHGVRLHAPDWSYESRSLAMHLSGRPENRQDHIFLIANAHWEAHEFELPVLPGWGWIRVDRHQLRCAVRYCGSRRPNNSDRFASLPGGPAVRGGSGGTGRHARVAYTCSMCQMSRAYSRTVRSLENLPDAGDVQDRHARPRRVIGERRARLFLRVQIRGQVRQVKIFVVLVEYGLGNPREQPGLPGTESIRAKRIDHPFHARISIVNLPRTIRPQFAHRSDLGWRSIRR